MSLLLTIAFLMFLSYIIGMVTMYWMMDDAIIRQIWQDETLKRDKL